MSDWLKTHWKTTLCGLLYIGCNVSALFFPPMAEVCPLLDKFLIAGGFIAAADGAVVNQLSQQVADMVKTVKGK